MRVMSKLDSNGQMSSAAANNVSITGKKRNSGVAGSIMQGKFPVQRQEEEELMQGKFPVQRQEEEELMQGKFPVQRQEEEELMPGELPAQLQEEEELM